MRISGQSPKKRNFHNSRTSDDIDMKLGPVTEVDKRDKKRSKKFGDDVMSKDCNVIAIFFQFTTNLEQSGSWIHSL